MSKLLNSDVFNLIMSYNDYTEQESEKIFGTNIYASKITAIKDFTRFNYVVTLELVKMDLVELPENIKMLKHLSVLKCHNNKITQLDNLPRSLVELCCRFNRITQLNNLPQSLVSLYN